MSKLSKKFDSPLTLTAISIVWWVIVFIVGAIALRTIPFTNTFSNYALEQRSTLPEWVKRWANFDGGAYIILSDVGYQQVGLLQAYFPVYPLVIRGLVNISLLFLPNTEMMTLNLRFLMGLGFNFVCSTLFLIVLNKYLALRFNLTERKNVILSFLLFPTTFYLHAIYTESVFLLLLVFCLYAYHKRWMLRLMLALILLTATRVVGVFLIPAIALDMYLLRDRSPSSHIRRIIKFFTQHLFELVIIGAGTLGLFSYMAYLYFIFGDPLYFFHVQSSFGAGRQQNPVLFLQVIWRYFKILWTARPINWKYFAYVQEFAYTMFTIFLLGYGLLRSRKWKLQIPEMAFSFGAFFLPTLTGNFSSMPRYILVCLPLFIILGQVLTKHKTAKICYIIAGCVFSFINIMLFIQGHWIA